MLLLLFHVKWSMLFSHTSTFFSSSSSMNVLFFLSFCTLFSTLPLKLLASNDCILFESPPPRYSLDPPLTKFLLSSLHPHPFLTSFLHPVSHPRSPQNGFFRSRNSAQLRPWINHSINHQSLRSLIPISSSFFSRQSTLCSVTPIR